MLRTKISGAVALAMAAVTGAGVASAQDVPDIALNQYQPPFAGDDFMAVPRPAIGGHLVPRGMLTFDYSKDPLVLVDQNDNVIITPVSTQMFLHFGASFALWDRLMIDASFPLAIVQSGEEDTSGSGVDVPLASGAAPGDLRFGLRGRLFGEYYDPFQISVGGFVWVPTAGEDTYVGEGSVYGEPHLLLGGRVPFFLWSANAGAVLRGSDNPHTFTYRAAAGVLLIDDMLLIGPEVFGQVNLADRNFLEGAPPIERKGAVSAEVLGSVQLRFVEDLVIGAGAGAGVTDGVGTPQLRVLGRFMYAPEPDKEQPAAAPSDRDDDGIIDSEDACPDVAGVSSADPAKNGCPPDRDNDGILDDDDACPDVPGVANDDPEKHGCPPPGDRDGDGINDEVDACPDEKGVASDDPTKHGCPDRDGDGIFDAQDACPDVAGVENADPKKNGCPPDRDNDGIIDAEDACPDEPGVKNADPKKNGCPRVVVTEKEIVILQKVEFDFDKATIKPVSDSLLDEVAETLKKNPDIALIEVQGHTDNKGTAFYNQRLSGLRADAVKQALIARGVEAARLRSKGYGQSKPIASNDTDEGRADNRRVQFQILKRDKK